MPKVSVIIPTFNSADYIQDTLQSILEQAFQDFEIIVVDDASTDSTECIVCSLHSEKIRYIRLPANHGGPSKARNVGVMSAKGIYIALFDSDDIMQSGRLFTAVKVLDNLPDVGMTFTNIQKFDEKTGDHSDTFLKRYERFAKLKKTCIGDNLYIINKEDAFNCLFHENYISTSSVTFRKNVFDQVGCFDEELTNADDLDMWFRITHKFDVGFADIVTVRYRVREGSISGRGVKLANNRAKVYSKQRVFGLNRENEDQVHKQLAEIFAGMGYSYRCANMMGEARRCYLSSLREIFSWRILVSYLITFLGSRFIGLFRGK